MSKYLWIAHEGNYTGANRAALEFTDILRHAGHQVVWVLPSQGTFVKALAGKGYDFNIIGFYNWTIRTGVQPSIGWIIRTTLGNLKSIFFLTKFIRRGSFDYVVSNTICFYVGAVSALISVKKHIWLIHEFGEEDHEIMPWVGTRGYRWLGGLSEKVIVNSEAVKDKFKMFVDGNKLGVLNNIITIDKEPKHYIRHTNDILKLLMLGQITSGKGHLEALHAIARLGDDVKKVKLSIIGSVVDNAYDKQLKQFVDANNLGDVVTFFEHTENPQEEILGHDLLLMCSQYEAYGRVTVESILLGVPVIGKNSGNTKFLVKSGVNGLLYNDVIELQQILMKLINDSVSLAELSQGTQTFARTGFGVPSKDVLKSFTVVY